MAVHARLDPNTKLGLRLTLTVTAVSCLIGSILNLPLQEKVKGCIRRIRISELAGEKRSDQRKRRDSETAQRRDRGRGAARYPTLATWERRSSSADRFIFGDGVHDAQHDSFLISVRNDWATSLRPSLSVRYGAHVVATSSTVSPNLIA